MDKVRPVRAQDQLEGAGFLVHRPFPSMALPNMDPFLLLDQMGPMQVAPGEAKGAPDHPHRGFETVTYMLEGRMEHRDSHGHAGSLGPGDVQWMTAGSGVVHSEMPSPAVMADGGVMHGVQLWVNLPAAQKMRAPRYQEIAAKDIPKTVAGDATVHVLSGHYGDVQARLDTIVPVRYLHVVLPDGGTFDDEMVAGHNAFVYVLRGSLEIDGQEVPAQHLLQISGKYRAQGRPGTDFLVLSGKPLNEPVARYGPFVMNTREEIHQAIEDYHAGRFGTIAPELNGGRPYLPGTESPPS